MRQMDPYQAIERIAEEKGQSMENDYGDIAKGVIILRKIRNKSKMAGENK
ncbi:hypothetical protein SAMN04487831_103244 [Pseudobutyrivibrio sp. UC1225]|nr:hypothetical protein [Pseudobutyrivibrio sp. UC1225]SFN77499.1 hypothetical protein SAMN04487831_103244 [Pseudobutyrivibrio sp. UC1225]